MSKFLRIDIPFGQMSDTGSAKYHVVEIVAENSGDQIFDTIYGIEMKSASPNQIETVARVQELTLTSKRFYFECIHLNRTRYRFDIKLKNETGFTIKKGSEETEIKIIEKIGKTWKKLKIVLKYKRIVILQFFYIYYSIFKRVSTSYFICRTISTPFISLIQLYMCILLPANRSVSRLTILCIFIIFSSFFISTFKFIPLLFFT